MRKSKSYLPRGQRIMNLIFSFMVRTGLIPKGHLISVVGRKTGIIHTTPIFVLQHEGQRWFVAGYNQSDWVKNLRVAGWCILFHNHSQERVEVIEIQKPEVQAPLLREFVRRAPGAGKAFTLSKDAPISEYIAIADEHPVFQIIESTDLPVKS